MKPGLINLSITYQEFEPGDIVTPANRDTILVFGDLYEVESFCKPIFGKYPQIYGVVFVKDFPSYGIQGDDLIYRQDLTAVDIPPKLLTQRVI